VVWLSLVTASVAPGIALLSYFYLKDRYDSEPISMVLKVFLIGALMVFPIMVLQRAFVLGFGENPFLFSFGISSGIEEFMKWFLLFFVIYKHRQFDEPYDGIVYATAISLGFATMENLIHALLNYHSVSTLLMRALLPVSGHALFGVMMGFHLGKAKFRPALEKKHLALALGLPVFYHGVFDYILLEAKTYWMWLILPFMVFLWLRGMWKVNRANEISPLRSFIREEEVKI